jgi:hypothetical protein
LVALVKKNAQSVLGDGLKQIWKNDHRISKYSTLVQKVVLEFEDAVNEVIEKTN